jgi:hypothetical protein
MNHQEQFGALIQNFDLHTMGVLQSKIPSAITAQSIDLKYLPTWIERISYTALELCYREHPENFKSWLTTKEGHGKYQQHLQEASKTLIPNITKAHLLDYINLHCTLNPVVSR